MATRRRLPAGGHKYPRSARLSETLREVIADELVKIDDERLEFVTITNIDVDNELNRAVVYFDSLAGESGDEAIIGVLEQHRRRTAGRRSTDRSGRRRLRYSTSVPTT